MAYSSELLDGPEHWDVLAHSRTSGVSQKAISNFEVESAPNDERLEEATCSSDSKTRREVYGVHLRETS